METRLGRDIMRWLWDREHINGVVEVIAQIKDEEARRGK